MKMVTATAILVAIAHDGSIGLALCLIEFPVPKKKTTHFYLYTDLHHFQAK